MKSIKISRLLFLTAFAIVAVLTACPAADSVPGPTFKNLGINVAEKKIIVFFSTDIQGPPDASRITLKKGSTTLKLTTDYTLAIEQGTLVMTLRIAPQTGDKYTVEIQGGAVKNAKGKSNTSSNNKTLTVGIIPAIKPDSLAFKTNSNTVLSLAFNTNIEIVDKSNIRVQVQTAGKGKFTDTPATSKVDTKNKTRLNLTLGTPATHNNVYRVKVGAGALKATESKLANIRQLTSNEFTYSTSPILNAAPYILDNKLVATFNLSIALKNRAMVKVYKGPTQNSDGKAINLTEGNIAVNADNTNLLEITLPAMKANEVYRLRLEAGAVNAKSNPDNVNKIITPADITIGAAPALDADNDPYLSGQKIIVTFNGPIRILNTEKIKYQLDGTTITPATTPTVVKNNQLVIPLNAIPAAGHVYRIHLDAGAITGKNTLPTITIKPIDKGIIVWGITAVKPAFDSTTQLSVTFPVAVAIVGDGSKIKVQKKDDGGRFTTLTAASRTIEVDGTDTKKIKITLTGSKETTLYKVWKVEFPPNTVKTRTDIPNAGPLTTLESEKPKLTDLYSWEEVPHEGEKWPARSSHTSVVFDPDGEGERIWVLGGSGKSGFNDVWSSTDGVAWIESKPPNDKDGNTVTKNNKNWWAARFNHTSVVFKGKIWVLGGAEISDPPENRNDVWSSADGSNWTESKPPNDKDGNTVTKNNKNWWAARYDHTSVVFNPAGNGERIWVLGGWGESSLNDVWSSPDGKTWTESTPPKNAEKDTGGGDANWWTTRSQHTSVVFNPAGNGERIWVLGGWGESDFNDVWSSADGVTWTESKPPNDKDGNTVTKNNKNWWAARYNHNSVVFPLDGDEKRVWVMGGEFNAGNSNLNDVWSSAPSSTGWTAENTLPKAIISTQAVVFKNRIWLLGGYYGGKTTDNVWKMGPASE